MAFATASGYDITLTTDNLSTSYTGSTNAISVYSGRDLNGNMSITDTGTTGSAPIWLVRTAISSSPMAKASPAAARPST